MRMSEPLRIGLVAVAGLALGAAYFVGLWWTVRKITAEDSPGMLVLFSFLVRNVAVAAGFVFASGGTWQGLVACLAGFVVARVVVVRLLANTLSPRTESPRRSGGETDARHTG